VSRSLPNRALHAIFSKVNQRRQWYELPTTSLKTLNLLSLRLDLRDLNLFDTGTPIRKHGLEEPPEEALTARRPDGKWNDLEDAEMGSTGTAFTRNINPKRIKPEKPPRLYDPSPRKVSLELMTRDEFKPAETLNVLAQAWIQFENHNWFFHGRGKPEEVLEIPRATTGPITRCGYAGRWRFSPTAAASARAATATARSTTATPRPTGGTARRSTDPIRRPRTRSGPSRTAS